MALNVNDVSSGVGAGPEEFSATPLMIALLVLGGLAILTGLTFAFRGAIHA